MSAPARREHQHDECHNLLSAHWVSVSLAMDVLSGVGTAAWVCCATLKVHLGVLRQLDLAGGAAASIMAL
jgi:hypothetical protein